MRGMNYLERLLDGAEVEWKGVGDIFNIYAGGDVPKDSFSDVQTKEFNIPILSNGIGNNSLYGWTSKSKIDLPSLTVSARGTIGWTSYRDTPFFPVVRLLVLIPKIKLNLKYAYHFMKMIEHDYKVPKTGIPQLTKPMLMYVRIPIPCPDNPEKSLAIQSEIVRILDAFTELTNELTNELKLREKQYNYYRDKLLNFSGNSGGVKPCQISGVISNTGILQKLLDGAEVEWMPLTSLCRLITTGKLNANAMDENGMYPFFTCNEDPYKINTYAFDLEAILISRNGSQVGHLNYYNGKFNAYQRTYVVGEFNCNVKIMYIYYYLMHTLKPYIHKKSRKGSVPYITMPMLENFTFPIPCPDDPAKSLSIQSEIVRILDKFDTLTNSISEGLPREIELRRKQYEYYRDLLFRFPR